MSGRRFLVPAVWTAVVTLSASGQAADPTAGRAGGLVPGGDGRRAGLTREELIREWDLDGDGTISKSEADVARGRMRKRRIEMQLQAGIDPLTGSPSAGRNLPTSVSTFIAVSAASSAGPTTPSNSR